MIGLLICSVVQAQDIQKLPIDPAVKHGVLPNGLAYYLAVNPLHKGVADFALVQKTGSATISGVERNAVVSFARENLASKQRLLSPNVQDFFLRHGADPRKTGFVEVRENATIFRFDDVLLYESTSDLDSALFVLMNIVANDSISSDLKEWYTPSDQAIIVSGDVDASDVENRLRMLSYMIPSAESQPRKEYVWTDSKELKVCLVEDDSRDIVNVTVEWRIQRTPEELMNTIQPLVFGKFLAQAGMVAEKRIAERLSAAGIPVADVSYDYYDSQRSLEDEKFSVSVSVAPDHMVMALKTLAAVMAGIDAGDVREDEFQKTDREYIVAQEEAAGNLSGNSGYVDRCIAAFMYNSDLTSEIEKIRFHSSRNLPEAQELALFNSVVSACVDNLHNVTVRCSGRLQNTSSSEVKSVFESAWRQPYLRDVVKDSSPASGIALCAPEEKIKVKVKSSRKDNMSGGTILKMSNGMTVIYKKMPADDKVHYSLALNGGYANMPGLREGDGAYISDFLDLCTIGGVPASAFHDEIKEYGMTMNLSVNMASTVLQGHVEDDRIDYLVRVLSSVMNDRVLDRRAFNTYRSNEILRLEFEKGSPRARKAAIDSIICPDYKYTSHKAPGRLSADFAERADAFMCSQASKMNDGVLVLVGDVDERRLRDAFAKYGYSFAVREHAFVRPVISYQPISGTVLYTLEGEQNSVDIVMSVPMLLTSDNYYVASLAMMALKKHLVKAVTGKGMWLQMYYNCHKYPQERLNLMISLEEASVEGFAPGTAHDAPMEALAAVRQALDEPRSLVITDAELASYKAMLKKHVAEEKLSPEYWLRSIVRRYTDSKDFSTGSDARIDAVTVDKVKSMLSSLVGGSKVEYIISKK